MSMKILTGKARITLGDRSTISLNSRTLNDVNAFLRQEKFLNYKGFAIAKKLYCYGKSITINQIDYM